MLTEHAKTVHSQLVNEEKYLRDILSNFLLKLSYDLENIVVSKHSVHSHNDFPHDDEDVLLNFDIDRLEQFWVLDSNWLKRVNHDIEQDVIHSLGVLNTRIRQSEEYFSEKLWGVLVLRLMRVCSVDVFVDLDLLNLKWL